MLNTEFGPNFPGYGVVEAGANVGFGVYSQAEPAQVEPEPRLIPYGELVAAGKRVEATVAAARLALMAAKADNGATDLMNILHL